MDLVIKMPDELYENCLFTKDINDRQLEHNGAFKARSLFEVQLVNCVASGTPLLKGHWIYDDDCKEHGHCSECGHTEDLVDGKSHNYCSNCGAKMESENKE